MAEAWTRKLHSERFEAYSAGTSPDRLDPRPFRVMEEVGIKLVVHNLIIVRERTESECPKLFLGALRRHFWPFPDPASVEGDPGKQIAAFREER